MRERDWEKVEWQCAQLLNSHTFLINWEIALGTAQVWLESCLSSYSGSESVHDGTDTTGDQKQIWKQALQNLKKTPECSQLVKKKWACLSWCQPSSKGERMRKKLLHYLIMKCDHGSCDRPDIIDIDIIPTLLHVLGPGLSWVNRWLNMSYRSMHGGRNLSILTQTHIHPFFHLFHTCRITSWGLILCNTATGLIQLYYCDMPPLVAPCRTASLQLTIGLFMNSHMSHHKHLPIHCTFSCFPAWLTASHITVKQNGISSNHCPKVL